jgi:response regulator RpfG family c-di-GMP phosphodiesterase
MNERILFVDDEPNILMAFKRQLRTQFQIETANSGRDALFLFSPSDPFAVIVSDLRMPVMDGIQFLAQSRETSPDSVRILLTGHADLSTAIDAVNQGDIFRFLTKPCSLENLTEALNAALEQYRLVTAERELLEKTLSKTIKLMADMLILANPVAYGRAMRIRRIVKEIVRNMNLNSGWQFELAATLSQTGCVALPDDLLEKVFKGKPLTKDEESLYASHPMIGYKLLENIPRLEAVAQMVRDQLRSYSSYAEQPYSYKSHEIEQGAQILRVASDYDRFSQHGHSHAEIIRNMLQRTAIYDTELVEALGNKSFVDDPWESRLADIVSSSGNDLKQKVLNRPEEVTI